MEFGAWRSLVAHLPWEQGVGRSNRLAPIFAPVAQGKEQRPSKPRVRGSNPFWRAPKPVDGCPLEGEGRADGTTSDKGGECSSVGRAPGCGLGGRGFKSLHSPQFSRTFVQGPLAQLVEQLTLNQRVRSSSLRRPTKKPKETDSYPKPART